MMVETMTGYGWMVIKSWDVIIISQSTHLNPRNLGIGGKIGEEGGRGGEGRGARGCE